MKLAQQAEGFKVDITFVGLSRHLLRQQTEFGIAMIVKAMRAASGYDVRPTGVKFAHIRTGDVQEFRRFFGCSVEFGAPADQLGVLERNLRSTANHRRPASAGYAASVLRGGCANTQDRPRLTTRFG